MKTLFVSNILPMEVVHAMNRSIAGARFQVSLAENLDKHLDGELELFSVVRSGHKEAKRLCDYVVFDGKKYQPTFHIAKPFLDELLISMQVFAHVFFWCFRNRGNRPVVLNLNAANEVMIPLLLLKKMGLCEVYSFLIDSPFADTNQSSCYLRWRKKQFQKGLDKLNQINGVILLNKTVQKILHLQVPTKTVLLGFEPFAVEFDRNHYSGIQHRKKRLLYAGTLSKVNGIEEMLQAFERLPQEEYQIDICGFGPMGGLVQSYAATHPNCVFHGQVEQQELNRKYEQADLALNIRLKEDTNNDYSFPSKMISYIYSGTLVLSSDFSSLPDDYRAFLYVSEDDRPETIAKNIVNVFRSTEEEMIHRSNAGREYVLRHQSWYDVAREISEFLKSPAK